MVTLITGGLGYIGSHVNSFVLRGFFELCNCLDRCAYNRIFYGLF